jgi:hypothetical protein
MEASNNIRPAIIFNDKLKMSPIEKFQNQSVRPVIKMMHQQILNLFLGYPNQPFSKNNQVSPQNYFLEIKRFIDKQISLKYELIGMVSGQFNQDEFEFYLENKTEITKRVIAMIAQRISDTHKASVKI